MVQSMTAFAKVMGKDENLDAIWEIRTVNHRYFDCHLKLPEVFSHLEPLVRKKLQQDLYRGKVDCSLKIIPIDHNVENQQLNRPAVNQLVKLIKELSELLPNSKVDPMRVLAWPQVLKTVDPNLVTSQPLIEAIFDQTLTELIAAREREGKVLAETMMTKLQQMTVIINRKLTARMPQVLLNRRTQLTDQLKTLAPELIDQNRLEQELVYFAQKMDITEELDRLAIHLQETTRTISAGGTMGKKLDFLLQELHRETNTIAAKANDLEITQATIELRLLIEQIREQLQNIV